MSEVINQRKLCLVVAGLVLVTCAAFYPVFWCGFITFDDPFYVYDNPAVREGLSWTSVQWAFTAMHASNWHPLTWLSHMLDCEVVGLRPAGHHATNLLLHTANTLLLFAVLRQLTATLWRSALVAALFAVHPLHVESVAWISERKDVLSAFFGLLALLAYTKYAQKAESRKQKAERETHFTPSFRPPPSLPSSIFHLPSSHWYWLALLFFALGLMSKPMLVTLPCLLLLLDYWPLGRMARVEGRRSKDKEGATLWARGWPSTFDFRPSALRGLIVEKLPFFALVVASSVLTVIAQSKSGAVAPVGDITVFQRLANSAIAVGWYVLKLFWPLDLAIIYPLFPTRDTLHVLLGSLVVFGFSILAAREWRRRPQLFTGWFWFLGTLVPVVGLVQVGMQCYADRYTYFPYIGLLIVLAWGLAEWVGDKPARRQIVAMASVAAVLACAVVTNSQTRHWRNGETVFRRAVSVTDSNYIALNNLGFVLAEDGRTDEAIGCYQQALMAAPRFADALNNLGCAYLDQKKLDLALPAFREAVAIKPRDVRMRNNMASALHEFGDYTNAIAEYRAILAIDPAYAEAHYNLGNSLTAVHEYTNAVVHYRKAIELRPQYPEAHLNLGFELIRLGDLREAREAFTNALRWRAEFPNAHFGLASVAAAENDPTAEAAHLQNFLAAKPDHAEARVRLAMALAAMGQDSAALAQAEELVRRQPGHAPGYYCLGVLAGQRGDALGARRAYEDAIRLQPEYPEVLNNLAWQFATSAEPALRDGPRAVELARRACELTRYEAPMLIGTLAAAHAEAGQFPAAVAAAERALARATTLQETNVVQRNRELLELYRAGKPFHETFN